MTAGEEPGPVLATLAAVITVAVSGTPIMLQPGMVQGMVDFLGYSAAEAGTISSLELMGFVGAAILFALIGPKVDWRRTIFAAGILVVVFNVVSMYMDTYTAFAAARFAAGSSAGLVTAVAWAVLGQSAHPTRDFGWATMGILVFSAFMFWQLPNIFSAGNYSHFLATYSACIVISLLAVILAPGFRRGSTVEKTVHDGGKLPIFSFVGGISASSILIFHVGYLTVYVYMSLIGEANGLSVADEVAPALALSQFAGIAGAFSVVWLGEKFDYLQSTAVVVIAGAIGLYAFSANLDYSLFLILTIVFQYCWNAGMPLILGIVATGDRTGSLIRAAIPLQFVGMSAGAALGSRIVDAGASYATLATVAAVISACSLLAIAPLGLRVRKVAATG